MISNDGRSVVATGYGGTYQAVVIDNVDPNYENRLLVRVPEAGIEAAWAAARSGSSGGPLPAVGDEVLVQFEGGDTDHPVWHGAGFAAPATATHGGVYRGTVIDNVDPNQSNRVKVEVPDVLGTEPAWAAASAALGSSPSLPDVGTGVWVEFENGSPEHPIWTGLQ